MNAPANIAADLESDLLERLDRLAGRIDKSRAWLIREAVRRYVDEQTAYLDFIQEGIDDLEAGRFITHEEMESWFEERRRSIAAE